MVTEDNYRTLYGDASTTDRAAALGLHTYDTALPQTWADDVRVVMEQSFMAKYASVFGHFVWCYDGNSIYGYPVPITSHGAHILDKYAVMKPRLPR